MRQLSKETREKLIIRLVDWRKTIMFGDGQEEEYVLNGFPDIKGLNQMTDQELVDEFGGTGGSLLDAT